MTKTLEDRLRDAKGTLLTATGEVTRSTNLGSDVRASFHELLEFGENVEHCFSMLQTRKAARQMLTDLESQADAQDEVPFGRNRIRFQHARLIGVQAYLTANWAIADQLTGIVGRIFCIKQSSGDPKHPLNWSHTSLARAQRLKRPLCYSPRYVRPLVGRSVFPMP